MTYPNPLLPPEMGWNGPGQNPATSSAATDDDRALASFLARKISDGERDLQVLDNYYTGTQPLRFLSREISQQVGGRLPQLAINWPRTIVDSVQRRTYVEGFRVGQGGQADDELWRIWQENDLDEWSQLGHVDALVHGRAFLMVWANDEDPITPRVTVESAHQMAIVYEPGMRRVRAALKQWVDGRDIHASLMYRDRIVRFVREAPSAAGVTLSSSNPAAWVELETLPNPLGVVPVVPLVNRPRVLNLDGESELADVMSLADAVNKLASDLMVTSEFHAGPRRWATGVQIPEGPARERLQAEVKQYWDNATKGKTWLAGEGVQFGQFAEANLSNFTEAIRLLTAQIAAVAGLPPHYLGLSTDNPASADAIRSAEATLVERAREKMRSWGGAYERAMRLAIAVRDGVPLSQVQVELRGMETIWRDPETPTVAQSADAAVKLYQAGIIDDVAAQERVGIGPTQRAEIAERRETSLASVATADVRARVALAQTLQAEQGLSQNAALAASGLTQAAALNSAETSAI